MNSPDLRSAPAPRRARQLTIVAVALLSVLLVAKCGQLPRGFLSGPDRILFDSLLAANEAKYDLADPTLAYDRLGCLEERGVSKLGQRRVELLSEEAGREVRSRHSRAEWEAVNRGLWGDHPAPTAVFCRRIDWLWYARTTANPAVRP